MSRTPIMLAPALFLLAACTPTATDAASAVAPPAPVTTAAANANPAATNATASEVKTTGVKRIERAPAAVAEMPAAEPAGASISGAISDGNRAPPALRVCATPVGGGAASCIETSQGAREYRIKIAPGRYYLLGWVRSGELKLIAHASQIRCIQAPCPPDELMEVTVAAGQRRDGIDLNGGYIDIPQGWPQAPG